MPDEQAEKWNKIERIAVAGHAAPRLRAQSEETIKRKVHLVDKDGNVVRYASVAEVQAGLLRRRDIEFDVTDNVKPKTKICTSCGRTFAPQSRTGRRCRSCLHPNCADCGKPLPFAGTQVKKKRDVRCFDCSMAFKKANAKYPTCEGCGVQLKNYTAKECRPCRVNRMRPPDVSCKACGAALSTKGRVKARAGTGTGYCLKCHRQNSSSVSLTPEQKQCRVCHKKLSKGALSPKQVAKRKGRLPTCRDCFNRIAQEEKQKKRSKG